MFAVYNVDIYDTCGFPVIPHHSAYPHPFSHVSIAFDWSGITTVVSVYQWSCQ